MHAQSQRTVVVLLLAVAMAAVVEAQERRAIEIKSIPVAENVYMLAGAGGNLGLSVGDDGALLIDSEYAPLTEKITAAKPTNDLDEKWGRGGFEPDVWVGIVYDGMTKE